MILEVARIDTYYGTSHVLQGIDLHAEQGETVALLGRNGAGKTTMLRSIMGLTPPRAGSVRFLGQEILAQAASDRRIAEGHLMTSAAGLAGAGFIPFTHCHGIFGVGRAILVTQAFHLPRALFTCRSLGVDAVGNHLGERAATFHNHIAGIRQEDHLDRSIRANADMTVLAEVERGIAV